MAAPTRFLLATVAVAAIAVGAALWFATHDHIDEPHAGAPLGAAILSTSFATAATEEAPPPAPEARLVDSEHDAPVERIEVCGVGWVDAAADGSVALAPILAGADVAAARQRLIEALRSRGDLGEAAVLVLAADADADGAAAREQLVRVAATTRDPRVYSLAFRNCTRHDGAPACAGLSAAEWARLDADNAAPWLYLLADASARGDTAALDEALFHVGAATRDDERFHDVAELVASEAGASDIELLAAEQSAERAVATMLALQPSYQPLVNACTELALRDANRRQACELAASVLAERSSSLRAVSVGADIGRRLGWPDERLDAVNAIVAAAPRASSIAAPARDQRPVPAASGALDCAALRKTLARFVATAQAGEVGAVRRVVERGRDEDLRRRQSEQRSAQVDQEVAPAVEGAPTPTR